MVFDQRCSHSRRQTAPRDVEFVTSETHFTNDLGADLLDRVELMLAIEDKFAGVQITDDDVERIQVVGDLIRHLNVRTTGKSRSHKQA
jgi:acyl carrier protein